MQEHQETLPWFKPPVTLLLRRPRFDTRPDHVKSVVYKAALGEVLLPILLFLPVKFIPKIPAEVRCKAWVCGRSLDGIAGSNPAGGMDVCLL